MRERRPYYKTPTGGRFPVKTSIGNEGVAAESVCAISEKKNAGPIDERQDAKGAKLKRQESNQQAIS
jgi:hypothetical protein